MTWKPITTVESLIDVFEKSDFDLKKLYDLTLAKVPYDIARDVAAFASAVGGTVLVGATEDDGRIGTLPGIVNVPQFAKEIGSAVQKFCVPWPAYQEVEIAVTSEERRRIAPDDPGNDAVRVMVVNVPPDVRGPIGVRAKNDKGNAVRDAYCFPVRVGERTDFLRPEQLSMWMNSHDRRIAIRLREVTRGTFVHAYQVETLNDGHTKTVIFESVDEGKGIAIFSTSSRVDAHVPLAFITAVWAEPAGREELSIKVDGTLFPDSHLVGFIPSRG
jgi:hypothetical protein